MQQRFSQRTVIVTGASLGIGGACARRFSEEGANVVLVARARDRLDAFASTLPSDRTLACSADVTEREQVDRMIAAAVDRFGGIDVLVSNAGVFRSGSLAATSLEDWRLLMSTNLDACFHCAQAALPYLVRSRGNIVHLASASGLGGDWGCVGYNAAKGALVNLTRAMALDLGHQGVRVNALAPTLTNTPMSADAVQDDRLRTAFIDRIALGRLAEADDIAGPCAFLASDDARFVTGVILPVDGGISAASGQPPVR